MPSKASKTETAPLVSIDALDTSGDSGEDPSMPKFVLDFSMFRVAKQLRLLGYNVVCDARLRQAQLLQIAAQQQRILVSGGRFLGPQASRHNRLLEQDRRRRLAGADRQSSAAGQRKKEIVGYNSDGESVYAESSDDETEVPLQVIQVRATDPHDVTLQRIMSEVKLVWDPSKIFTRCVTCNTLIKPIPKRDVEGLVHPTVFRVYSAFYQCPLCKKVYWGVDNGVVVNYKALRTIEYLKRYTASCVAPASVSATALCKTSCTSGSGAPPMPFGFCRHFLSYPRNVKCTIFEYLSASELDALVDAFPMLTELSTIVRTGAPRRFVPEWKMKDREQRRNMHATGKTVSIELTNGEFVNGTVAHTDAMMNVVVRSAIRCGAAGDAFWSAKEVLIRGTGIVAVRMDPDVLVSRKRPPALGGDRGGRGARQSRKRPAESNAATTAGGDASGARGGRGGGRVARGRGGSGRGGRGGRGAGDAKRRRTE